MSAFPDAFSARWAEPAADVAVVVVVSDPGDGVADLLDSLAAATVHPLDVVLVGPIGDNAQLVALAASTGARIVHTDADLGYGGLANVGVRATIAEFVVVANADVVWRPGALDRLLAAVTRWPTAAVFGPLIRTPDGAVYPSARARPSLWRGIGHALYGWWWPGNPWTASYRLDREAPQERAAGWLSASCLLLRRDAFDAVGGFDPDYLRYFEDLDLSERLYRAGWRSVYVPSAQVTGTGRQGPVERPALVAADQHRGAWLYLQRRYSGFWNFPLRAVLRAGLWVRAGLARRSTSVATGAALPRRDEPGPPQ